MRDADGYIQQVAEITQDSVKDWAAFPEKDPPKIGQLKTYIINCPELHPVTFSSLHQQLESKGLEHAAKVQCALQMIPKPERQYKGNYTGVLVDGYGG